MPLNHSGSDQAFKQNVSTLMGEVGKSPHVQSREQALAIAYATKRRNRALGGPAPWFIRNEARAMTHSGPINSMVPGRTDRHNVNVSPGSYVFPADFVSHLGQNNSMAGMAVLNHMFSPTGPYGAGRDMPIRPGAGAPRPPKAPSFSQGGDSGGARGSHLNVGPVPIVVAGGEHILEPEYVARIGGGDLTQGHKILDHWVMQTRKNHIKTLKGLPPPAKS